MKATLDYGHLQPVPRCQIFIPTSTIITLEILPEITDSKSASYPDSHGIGRSFPIKTYSHSENRIISMKCHFIILHEVDISVNMQYLRALQSAVYPRESQAAPYLPPPICQIRCGNLLAGPNTDGWLCAILRSYNASFPTDVVWACDQAGGGSYLPYKFDIDLSWEAVYANTDLPGQEQILTDF